ncbi:hypothetical protein F0U44_10195 [Nocardioides humilatus]|uniref:Uncharacterized protein n=1 Tax=Nocardioides humilatus TaxID=2607660 RepID=A0A5B1LDW5_9ACTN|nr:hypothetical protein [Nocardioides humilatus]KAA1418845.1 hypothetical protein F0U44_10195 [Nocardioides humilatus]
MGTWGEAYLARLRGCAELMGQELVPVSDRDRSVRLVESDARTVEEGFGVGLLELATAGKVRTRDGLQSLAWLVAGDPPEPRWESLPQLAGYVELLRRGYPEGAVRFATPESELKIDLAALSEDGHVLILGVARPESLLLAKLEALVPTFEEGDPRTDRTSFGCDAHRVATQLWATRAPYLWLVAAGARRVLRVTYGRTITLRPVRRLPRADELWPYGFDQATPRIVSLASGLDAAAG